MKTALTRIALLLLTIQGVVNAQVSVSSSRYTKNTLEPTIQHRTSSISKDQGPSAATDNTVAVSENKLSDLTERISQLDKQIEELMRLKAGLDAEKNEYLVADNTYSPAITVESEKNITQDYVSQIDQLLDLQNEANELYQTYSTLINEAKTKSGSSKIQITSRAKVVFQQYEFKQISASELSSNVKLIKYNENKITITNLVNDYKGLAFILLNVKDLCTQAEQTMKMAKEIREEAKAQPSNSAKIGAYSNAEEKETLALNNQDEAIKMLEQTAQLHFTILMNDLAFN